MVRSRAGAAAEQAVVTVAPVDPAVITGYVEAHPAATVREVARVAGCSPASVWFVLHGRPHGRPGDGSAAGRPRPGGREFSEAELIAVPAPSGERVAGERSAARRRAELVMAVSVARLAELLGEFRGAGPTDAASMAREAAAELDGVAGALRRLGEGRPRRG